MDPLLLGSFIVAASFIGLLDAVYFVLVTYRRMSPDPRWLPRFCRMDEESCAAIVDTRYARVLGLPNAVYGVVWFLASGVAGAWHALGYGVPYCVGFVVVATGTVILSVYLFWSLVARLRVHCVLCYAGHLINVSLLSLWILACA